ncbi:MAG: SDR family oxidoreductase [Candidatus Sumerlaeia bacterium]|nr:SDR family oxidoreductase [Candidatus Sumerlaeia bacterium]
MGRPEDFISLLERAEKIDPRAQALFECLCEFLPCAAEHFGAAFASVLLLDPETKELRFEFGMDAPLDELRKVRLRLGEGIAGWVALGRRISRIEDVGPVPMHSKKVDKITGHAEIYPQNTFDEVLGVNLVAPTYWALEMMARIAADRKRRGLGRWEPEEDIQGSVVFIGSVSAQGNKGQISYAASKAGLAGVAATLDHEAIFHGVRCAVIHPGYTDTPMVRALGEDLIDQAILPQTQLRRLLRPDEVADAIVFMLRNSAVSGSLWVDAGWHPAA